MIPYPAMDFVPFDILTAEELDHMAANIDSLAAGTGLAANAIPQAALATTTRKVNVPIVKKSVNSDVSMYPNASDQRVLLAYTVPDDYVSGNFTFRAFISGPSSGNLSMYRYMYRVRAATAIVSSGAAIFDVVAAAATQYMLYSFTISNTTFSFAAGDLMVIELHRDGPGVADTATTDADLNGAWVEYTGRV